MKAVRAHQRGGPESLVYEDAPMPKLRPGDVLIKVHAAGTTPTEFTWNSTWTDRNKQRRTPIVPSFEVSGTVEELAPRVSDFAKGDAIYGLLDFWRDGAAAEYVAASASGMALKPVSIDHVEAASVPLSCLTAWQALFDHATLSKGDTALIHGAGGGVGIFAVQLAHWYGAHVIATASGSKAQFLRELGADEVIDYKQTRFEEKAKDIDVVLDTVGGDTLDRSWETLRRGGTLVTIVGDAPEETAAKHGVKAASILVEPNRSELNQIAQLIDAGKIHPVIEAVYPLTRTRGAYERGLFGHNRGKVVLRVLD